ncbi:hypothetical protein [Xanthocytophaga agilis]|uniref:Uncharacterized protein n=1 Tax=Xanthocytophaga agilis TaxID=3048010 RepID=A0AAE3RE68_9BACT|nr:hypothetical protein [Xanthocytophaga agilis]MDJ1506572.1 hypothetical protein [Xanthocytophaga agilis]
MYILLTHYERFFLSDTSDSGILYHIIEEKTYNLTITSDVQNSKAVVNQTTYNLPAIVKVKRSKEDLPIKLITDSTTALYTLKSSLNPHFIYGNLVWTYIAPAAYLIDLTNPKRFYYGNHVYLRIKDSTTTIESGPVKSWKNYFAKDYSIPKGHIDLTFSTPYINSFSLKPAQEKRQSNTGFWGAAIGINYYYQTNRYLRLTANAAADFFLPIPAAVDLSGEYQLITSTYLSLTNNYCKKRFVYGYGLNFSRNTWDFRYYDRFSPPPPTRDPVKKTSHSLGVTLNGYHMFSKYLFAGLIYRPTLLRFDTKPQLAYEHLISVEIGCQLSLRKSK